MPDITETDYFDKPADNILIKYLPHIAAVGFVMIITGFWYANLIQTSSPKSNAAEFSAQPIQLPTSITTPTPIRTPTPTLTILKK